MYWLSRTFRGGRCPGLIGKLPSTPPAGWVRSSTQSWKTADRRSSTAAFETAPRSPADRETSVTEGAGRHLRTPYQLGRGSSTVGG